MSRPGVLFLVAGLYLTAFPYHPGLRSPNELCRLWQARALVEHRTLQLNEALRQWGYVGDLSVKDGRYYPSKAPLLSFLAAPIYAALKLFGDGGPNAVPEVPQVFWSRLFLTVLPTLLMLVWLRRFLRSYVSEPVADALCATYALGSLAFAYSLLFMSHQVVAVLLFASFYSLWRCQRNEWRERGYLLAGAFAGASLAAEYTAGLALLGLLSFAAVGVLGGEGSRRERWLRLGRRALLATVGALPFVLFLAAYHQAAFGHPLHTGYKYLADQAYQPWHLGGFLGIRYPDPRAFALSLFSPLRGLFTLAPFLLLALPGLFRLREWKPLFWLTVSLLFAYAYFTSSFSYESWGWTSGPRHLTPLVPFLLLPAGLFLERLRQPTSLEERIGLGLVAGACAGSIVVSGVIGLVNYVPDAVSNAFFGLALPLFRQGYLPPSVFTLLGLPNPWAGLPLLVALLVAAGWVAFLLAKAGRAPTWVAGALTLLAYFGLLAVATRHDAADTGAQAHLEAVWLAPQGKSVDFWPSP